MFVFDLEKVLGVGGVWCVSWWVDGLVKGGVRWVDGCRRKREDWCRRK